MSDDSPDDQASRLERDQVRLRQRMAELADAVAHTEEVIAATFEQVAENRSPSDAARLRQKAEEARAYAAKERSRGATHGEHADSS